MQSLGSDISLFLLLLDFFFISLSLAQTFQEEKVGSGGGFAAPLGIALGLTPQALRVRFHVETHVHASATHGRLAQAMLRHCTAWGIVSPVWILTLGRSLPLAGIEARAPLLQLLITSARDTNIPLRYRHLVFSTHSWCCAL